MNLKMLSMSLFFMWFMMSCQKEEITSNGMAKDHFFLRVDGQSMPVTVEGNLDAGKMLILLHGGPGTGVTYFQHQYVKDNIHQQFAVVYWDQRLAGMTQGNKGEYEDISVYREDLKKLIYLLKAKYGAEKKFYLLGHSWGGFLAPYFLIDNQEMITGWIQVDGAHQFNLLDSLTRQMLLKYGKEEIAIDRNVKKWKEIIEYCEKENISSLELNKHAHNAEKLIQEVQKPDFSMKSLYDENDADVSSFFANAFLSPVNKKVWNQIHEIDISKELYKIDVPLLMMWGKYDFVCPSGLKEDIRQNVKSTDISEVIFQKSGHSPMFNETELFWQEVAKWINQH